MTRHDGQAAAQYGLSTKIRSQRFMPQRKQVRLILRRLGEYDQSPRGDFPEKSGICPDGYRAAPGYTARVVFFSEWLSQNTAPRGLIPFGAPSKESEFCCLQPNASDQNRARFENRSASTAQQPTHNNSLAPQSWPSRPRCKICDLTYAISAYKRRTHYNKTLTN
jgi:hypothetical protein